MTEPTVDEPKDLRSRVEPELLLRLVMDAAQAAAELPEDSLDQKRSLPLGLPRTMLTVLTYSYAIGLYSSEEIEAEMRRDPQLHYASAKGAILATPLRRFRRLHRRSIQRSLSAVLQQVGRAQVESSPSGELHDRDVNDTQRSQDLLFAWAAERRINQAVLADTMALDT